MKSLYSDRPIILDNKAKEIMKKLKPIQVEPKQVKISEMLEEGIKALKEFKPNKMEDNNNMENYIVINGKKTELTEEQLKQLGIEIEKKRNNPFNNAVNIFEDMPYYMIDHTDIEDGVATEYSTGYSNFNDFEKTAIIRANSFNDKVFANQVYLHELLNRKLLKYSYDHESEDCEWDRNGVNPHYYIYFDSTKGHFVVEADHYCRSQNIYFSSMNIAEQAIKDIVEPFMEEHPEFVW